MKEPLSRAQILGDLHLLAFWITRSSKKTKKYSLAVLSLQVVDDEADGALDPATRLGAFQRVIERVVQSWVASTPHPDDDPATRAHVAELLLYPPPPFHRRQLQDRRAYIGEYVARMTKFDHRNYEPRLLDDIAGVLHDWERAARAQRDRPVTLDVNLALRRDETFGYARALDVDGGDVVEVSGVIRLGDPLDWRHQASELRVAFEIGPVGGEIGCQVEAVALNARHSPGYTPYDSGTLSAAGPKHIRAQNLRAFYLQLSDSEDVDHFAWDSGRRIPDPWLQVWSRPDGRWTVHVRPTVDQSLTAHVVDALKVSFLLDVATI